MVKDAKKALYIINIDFLVLSVAGIKNKIEDSKIIENNVSISDPLPMKETPFTGENTKETSTDSGTSAKKAKGIRRGTLKFPSISLRSNHESKTNNVPLKRI